MSAHVYQASVDQPDAITRLSAIELSAQIKRRDISCVDVMTAYLDRIDKLNPRYNALVAMASRADLLAQAQTADQELANGQRRGWMHGMPQAPKDLALAEGFICSRGSRIFKDFVAPTDSAIVARAKTAGAIIIGKSNVPEFGLGSQSYNGVYGTTLNALNPDLCAGGSSGGAASALALHMLPVADGSDMMGSLRNPAAFNNVYGFRPSFGRVPLLPGVDQFVQQLGIEGPMGRSPQDCAQLLSTQAGFHPDAPLSLDGDGGEFDNLPSANASDSSPLAGVRIGWLADHGGYLAMQDGVLERCDVGLKTLADLGAIITPIKLNFSLEKLWQTWLVLRKGIQGGNLSTFLNNPEHSGLLKPEAVWEAQGATQATAADFYQASMARSQFYLAICEMYQDVDFMALPSTQVFPFDAKTHWPQEIAGRTMDTYHRWMEVVLPATMAGLPAMNLPVAPPKTSEPAVQMTGIQLMGGPRADKAVLQASMAYHRAVSDE